MVDGSASHIKREFEKGIFPSTLFLKGLIFLEPFLRKKSLGKRTALDYKTEFSLGWNPFLGALSLEKKALHRKEIT